MTTSVAFSSDGAEAIMRSRDAVEDDLPDSLPDEELLEAYELARCIEWINTNNYKVVALQFPYRLLVDSMRVSVTLEVNSNCDDVIILGETKYGDCCVNEVDAERGGADCLIHFGHACLSVTKRLPALYIFTRAPINVDHCGRCLLATIVNDCNRIVLLSTATYHYALESIATLVQHSFDDVVIAMPTETPDVSTILGHKLPLSNPADEYCFCHVGEADSASLLPWMLRFPASRFVTYDPRQRLAREVLPAGGRRLQQRLYRVEQAKDAKVVGILVGTLAVHLYPQMIERLRTLIKAAGKTPYVFALGKLNSAKLANFPSVDVFVQVACREQTIVDSTEFFKPVVTPLEMEAACMVERNWLERYDLEFTQLLPGGGMHVPVDEASVSILKTDVSLVTGRLRNHGCDSEPVEATSDALVFAESQLTALSQGLTLMLCNIT